MEEFWNDFYLAIKSVESIEKYMPKFREYISCLFKSKKIPSPYENYTEQFYTKFLEPSITLILSRKPPDNSGVYLDEILRLSLSYFLNNIERYNERPFSTILNIFNCKNKYYSTEFYPEKTKAYMDKVDILIETNYFKSASQLFRNGTYILPSFLKWNLDILKTLDNKYFEKNYISDFLNSMKKVLFDHLTSKDEELFRKLSLQLVDDIIGMISRVDRRIRDLAAEKRFTYCINITLSSIVPRQFEGLNALAEYAGANDKFRKRVLSEKIIDRVIDKSLHPQVSNGYMKLLSVLLSEKGTGFNVLEKYVDHMLHSDSENIEIYLSSLAEVFSNIPSSFHNQLFDKLLSCNGQFYPILQFLNRCYGLFSNDNKVRICKDLIKLCQDENDDANLQRTILYMIPCEDKYINIIKEDCIDNIKGSKSLRISSIVLYRILESKYKESDFIMYMDTICSLNDFFDNTVEIAAFIFSKFQGCLCKDDFHSLNKFVNNLIHHEKFTHTLNFLKTILNRNPSLLSVEYYVILLDLVCSSNPTDIGLITFLFEKTNNITDPDSKQSLETLRGVDILWKNIANAEISEYLANLYSNLVNPDRYKIFIDKVLEYGKDVVTLRAISSILSRYFHYHDHETHDIKITEFPIETRSVTIQGDVPKEDILLNVPVFISYFGLKERVGRKFNISPASFVLTREGGREKILPTELPIAILDQDTTFNLVKQSNNPFSLDVFESPIHLLEGKRDFFEGIIKKYDQNRSYFSYCILCKLEYRPAEPLKQIIQEIKNDKNPYYSLYLLNKIAHIEREKLRKYCDAHLIVSILKYAHMFYEVDGLVLKRYRELIFLYGFVSQNLDETMTLSAEVVKGLVKDMLSLLECESKKAILYMALGILVKICKSKVLDDNLLMNLVRSTIFDSNKMISGSIYKVIKDYDKSSFNDSFVELINCVNEDYYEFFFIKFKCIMKKFNWEHTLANLKSVVYKNFSISENPTVQQRLSVKFPSSSFQKYLFSYINELIQNEKSIDMNFFKFVCDNIALNLYKYSNPQKEVFETIFLLVSLDNQALISLVDILVKINKIKRPTCDYHESTQKGLENPGCTCYLNSTLQLLFHIKEYRDVILSSSTNKMFNWLTGLQRLFMELLFLPKSYCLTDNFIKSFTFLGEPISPCEQQDAIEFLHFFIDSVNDVIPASASIFTGKTICITSSVDNKDTLAKKEQVFTIFPLEVNGFNSLAEGLKNFLKPIELTKDNQYHVENIGKVDAKMHNHVLEAPTVLIFQLKRFSYNISTNTRSKINTKFSFPLNLDLTDIMYESSQQSNRENYSLYGFVMHTGCASFGHYYCYCKCDDKWYLFNDRDVTQVDESVITTLCKGGNQSGEEGCESAYILFYRKCTECDYNCNVCYNNDVLDEVVNDINICVANKLHEDCTYKDFVKNLIDSDLDPSLTLLISPDGLKDIKKFGRYIKRNPGSIYKNDFVFKFILGNNNPEARDIILEVIYDTASKGNLCEYIELVIKSYDRNYLENFSNYHYLYYHLPKLIESSNKDKCSFDTFIEKTYDFITVVIPSYEDVNCLICTHIDISSLYTSLHILLSSNMSYFGKYSKKFSSIDFDNVSLRLKQSQASYVGFYVFTHRNLDEYCFQSLKNVNTSKERASLLLTTLSYTELDIQPYIRYFEDNKSYNKMIIDALSTQASGTTYKIFVKYSFWINMWLFSSDPASRKNCIHALKVSLNGNVEGAKIVFKKLISGQVLSDYQNKCKSRECFDFFEALIFVAQVGNEYFPEDSLESLINFFGNYANNDSFLLYLSKLLRVCVRDMNTIGEKRYKQILSWFKKSKCVEVFENMLELVPVKSQKVFVKSDLFKNIYTAFTTIDRVDRSFINFIAEASDSSTISFIASKVSESLVKSFQIPSFIAVVEVLIPKSKDIVKKFKRKNYELLKLTTLEQHGGILAGLLSEVCNFPKLYTPLVNHIETLVTKCTDKEQITANSVLISAIFLIKDVVLIKLILENCPKGFIKLGSDDRHISFLRFLCSFLHHSQELYYIIRECILNSLSNNPKPDPETFSKWCRCISVIAEDDPEIRNTALKVLRFDLLLDYYTNDLYELIKSDLGLVKEAIDIIAFAFEREYDNNDVLFRGLTFVELVNMKDLLKNKLSHKCISLISAKKLDEEDPTDQKLSELIRSCFA